MLKIKYFSDLPYFFYRDSYVVIQNSKINLCLTVGQLNVSYEGSKIKQHLKVTFLECVLDECLTRKSMIMQVCIKTASKLLPQSFYIQKAGSCRKT